MLLEDKAFYCLITYKLHELSVNNTEATLWNTLKEINADPYNYRHDNLRHGICVPKTCPKVTAKSAKPFLCQEITDCYNEKFQHLGLGGKVINIDCEEVNPKYPVDCIDIVVGCLLIFYLIFVSLASVYDKQTNRYGSNFVEKFTYPKWNIILLAFSVPRNWNRLITVNKDLDTEKLRSIQGVRFYNMVLVILSHTVFVLFMLVPVSNTRAIETLTDRISTIFLASGPLAVSTFFLISSWLLIHGLFEKFKDKTRFNSSILLALFIHRYIRLTFTLAVVIAFHATWLRHLGSGPIWNHLVGQEYLRCRKNWWTNIFYVNNLVDPQNMCLHTTWYLALDTQYFGIILALMWFLKRYHKRILTILGSLLIVTILTTFYINYINGFPALLPPTPESLYSINHTLKNKQWHIQYTGFIGNMAGPIIGLIMGYLYNKYREKNVFIRKGHICLWWIITHTFCYGMVLIPGYLSLPKSTPHNIFWASVHAAISRPVFAFGIGFALFGVTQGIGSIIKWILEWPPLYVLGRLTYSAYLIHIPFLLLRAGMIRSPVYFNEYLVFLELVGHVVITYLAAIVFTLLFEMPVSELQKLIIPTQHKSDIKTKKEK